MESYFFPNKHLSSKVWHLDMMSFKSTNKNSLLSLNIFVYLETENREIRFGDSTPVTLM